MQQILQWIEAATQSQPAPIEFEMAYQARVAIDRIRFAIKLTEQFADNPRQLKEAGLHLLDALDRLESAERRFQQRFPRKSYRGDSEDILHSSNGSGTEISRGAQP
jgi:hypothetical protein